MSGTDQYFFVRDCFDIAKPVGISAKTTHHDSFRTCFSVLHYFQDRLAADSRAPARVRQQQETLSEQGAQAPMVEIDWRTKQMPQDALLMVCAHADCGLLVDSNSQAF